MTSFLILNNIHSVPHLDFVNCVCFFLNRPSSQTACISDPQGLDPLLPGGNRPSLFLLTSPDCAVCSLILNIFCPGRGIDGPARSLHLCLDGLRPLTLLNHLFQQLLPPEGRLCSCSSLALPIHIASTLKSVIP